MNDIYDRQNPDFYALIERLEDYAAKDYGTEAYPLSAAEAKLLLELVFDTDEDDSEYYA